MKKKFMGLMLVGVIAMLTLVGCGGGEDAPKEKKQPKPKVTIEEIEVVGLTKEKNDVTDSTYIKAKFKNNSKENIKGIQFTYEYEGEKIDLGTFDTLLPGETSTVVDTISDKDVNLEELKFLGADITIANKGEEDIYIEYDAKLDTYDVM